ncbi:MAG TPA: AMIN domain-containing protein [Candidatus Tenderia electrophaga]|uniref:N-acetylmuramoyl-L-alanine amidase AmiC n=1 Tax=Candidatus Tenderia electrophaga TaxID=1748243 RepID=A0A832N5S1_9GAMM|nr:AMIN domain-containing protein [Candidatus Tenderia electrophaga]
MRQIVCVLLFCLLPVSASMAANTLKYNTLRVGQHDAQTRLVLDLGGPLKYKYFSLSKPDRFVVDLIDVVRTGHKPKLNYANTSIKKVRSGIRNGNDLRMVIELKQPLKKAQVYLLKPAAGKGHRLVIELTGRSVKPVQRLAKAAAAKSAPVVSKAQPKKTVKHAKAIAIPKVKKKRLVVQQQRDIIVAIDAGHGGIDPGAKGHKGTREKDVVLAIARKLEKLIRREEGMRPLMIRDGDTFIKLANRKEKARRHKADFFISIHADAFPDKRAKGASVYVLSQRGATSEAAKLLANRENASDLVGGVSLDDKDDMLASVLLDLSQSATIEDSLEAGSKIISGLKHVARMHKRTVQQASFAVLKSPDIPSILVETAFISNPAEERNLRSSRYQQRLAEAMMSGIRGYFVANPPPGTRIAAREHVIKRGETLSVIALRYSISLKTLRVANRLKSDNLRIGQVLHIPTRDS